MPGLRRSTAIGPCADPDDRRAGDVRRAARRCRRAVDRTEGTGSRCEGRCSADRARRISGPRGRLHRVPHAAGGQGVRRRPSDGHAVRHALHAEHLVRQGDRHRQVDRRRVLHDDAHGRVARRRAALSRDAVRLLHEGHARRLRCDLRLSASIAAGEAAEPPARTALSVQQPRNC